MEYSPDADWKVGSYKRGDNNKKQNHVFPDKDCEAIYTFLQDYCEWDLTSPDLKHANGLDGHVAGQQFISCMRLQEFQCHVINYIYRNKLGKRMILFPGDNISVNFNGMVAYAQIRKMLLVTNTRFKKRTIVLYMNWYYEKKTNGQLRHPFRKTMYVNLQDISEVKQNQPLQVDAPFSTCDILDQVMVLHSCIRQDGLRSRRGSSNGGLRTRGTPCRVQEYCVAHASWIDDGVCVPQKNTSMSCKKISRDRHFTTGEGNLYEIYTTENGFYIERKFQH